MAMMNVLILLTVYCRIEWWDRLSGRKPMFLIGFSPLLSGLKAKEAFVL